MRISTSLPKKKEKCIYCHNTNLDHVMDSWPTYSCDKFTYDYPFWAQIEEINFKTWPREYLEFCCSSLNFYGPIVKMTYIPNKESEMHFYSHRQLQQILVLKVSLLQFGSQLRSCMLNHLAYPEKQIHNYGTQKICGGGGGGENTFLNEITPNTSSKANHIITRQLIQTTVRYSLLNQLGLSVGKIQYRSYRNQKLIWFSSFTCYNLF